MSKLLVLYHYYHPDEVVSAQLFRGLAEGLSDKGYEVEVWPSNRNCHDPNVIYGLQTMVVGNVRVRRVWRPNLSQHRFLGRLFNSIWMQMAWLGRLILSNNRPDAVILGTDPVLAIFLAPWIKAIFPKTIIVHWCFDLYPEAAIADGIVREGNLSVKLLRFLLKKAYGKCDLVADLGPCMRRLLERYSTKPGVTLTPWALEEPNEPLPADPLERAALFGNSSLGLLYSGSFGRAHDFRLTLGLARLTRNSSNFTYCARGSRLEELKKGIGPDDTNIRFADFAPQGKLAARLSAPDVHIVSLRPEWAGIVVPSKFFGALAAGRPILYEGAGDSDVANWIKIHGLGWVLSGENLDEVAKDLEKFSRDEERKTEMFSHCHEIYQKYFSKKVMVDGWAMEINKLVAKNS